MDFNAFTEAWFVVKKRSKFEAERVGEGSGESGEEYARARAMMLARLARLTGSQLLAAA